MSKMILKNASGMSFDITSLSAEKVAKLEGVAGNLGATSVKKLLKQGGNIKGWIITQEEEKTEPVATPVAMPSLQRLVMDANALAAAKAQGVKRANRQGVEFQGQNLKRNRLPMVINVELTAKGKEWLQTLQTRESTSCLRQFLETGGGEYAEIASKLQGWSRERVAIEASAAEKKGYITKTRQSNPIANAQIQTAA